MWSHHHAGSGSVPGDGSDYVSLDPGSDPVSEMEKHAKIASNLLPNETMAAWMAQATAFFDGNTES